MGLLLLPPELPSEERKPRKPGPASSAVVGSRETPSEAMIGRCHPILKARLVAVLLWRRTRTQQARPTLEGEPARAVYFPRNSTAQGRGWCPAASSLVSLLLHTGEIIFQDAALLETQTHRSKRATAAHLPKTALLTSLWSVSEAFPRERLLGLWRFYC